MFECICANITFWKRKQNGEHFSRHRIVFIAKCIYTFDLVGRCIPIDTVLEKEYKKMEANL